MIPKTSRSPGGMVEADRFGLERVKRTVESSPFWSEIIYLERVGSTNDVAKDLASQGGPAGTIVVADEQTAGRGRLGRQWIAPPHSSLLCSILFRPDLWPAQAHRLTMLCSLAAADAIERLAHLSVALKWPNDLVVKSGGARAASTAWRKLAGVLTETGLMRGNLTFVVVGIGINVNVPRDELLGLAPNATSILAETGHTVNRSELLKELLQGTEARYQRLSSGDNPRGEWSARLATLGRQVRVTTTEGTLEGVAEGVDANGALVLRTRSGARRSVVVGDVRLARG